MWCACAAKPAGGVMATRTLDSPPRILPLYARAAAATVGRRGSAAIPTDLALELPDVAIDPAHLAAYAKVCRFRLRDELPATYLHVVAFPLHLALMGDRRLPVRRGRPHPRRQPDRPAPAGAPRRARRDARPPDR